MTCVPSAFSPTLYSSSSGNVLKQSSWKSSKVYEGSRILAAIAAILALSTGIFEIRLKQGCRQATLKLLGLRLGLLAGMTSWSIKSKSSILVDWRLSDKTLSILLSNLFSFCVNLSMRAFRASLLHSALAARWSERRKGSAMQARTTPRQIATSVAMRPEVDSSSGNNAIANTKTKLRKRRMTTSHTFIHHTFHGCTALV
mmetsp:Transcript_39723/g.91657  ORF Transcript_39723/g.91657 Transcript_39723/m.91657 type:complete len:200 (+) Transcript_39723:377-976(+)